MSLRHRVALARAGYVAIILVAASIRLDLSADLGSVPARLERAVFRVLTWHDLIDGLRNVALFGGLGAWWIATGDPRRLRHEIRRVAMVGLALSVVIETVQLFSTVRWASLTDLLSNAAGTVAGAVAMRAVLHRLRARRHAPSLLGVPAFFWGGAYLFAAACEIATPLFRSNLLAGADGGPLARLRTALLSSRPLSFAAVSVTDVVLLLPAGFAAVVWLREHTVRYHWRWVALGGALFAFVAEVGHGMLGISLRWEAAAVNASAIAVGAWLGSWWLGRRQPELHGLAPLTGEQATRWRWGYVALLAVWALRPFSLHHAGPPISFTHLVPFASFAGREDVFSALHVLQTAALFIALGAVFAVRSAGGRHLSGVLGTSLVVAAALEVGRLILSARAFDVTNVVVSVGGAVLAWLVLRRAGFPLNRSPAPASASAPPPIHQPATGRRT